MCLIFASYVVTCTLEEKFCAILSCYFFKAPKELLRNRAQIIYAQFLTTLRNIEHSGIPVKQYPVIYPVAISFATQPPIII